ncbi:hypothetical protein BDR26DRAFT_854436 [Obelidium mucronatum]|nr:hypothetical protein BDR26DRAFT_854436 [Obelidium mucronatum]
MRDWTPRHSEELVKAVGIYGFKWTLIQQDPLFTGFRLDFIQFRYWCAIRKTTDHAKPSELWTKELDALLVSRVSAIWAFTPRPWIDLALQPEFNMFTPKQIHARWKFVADPVAQAKDGAYGAGMGWGSEHDDVLFQAVNDFAQSKRRLNFGLIPRLYPLLSTFGSWQLRHRYTNLTKTPSNNSRGRINWTPEEDAKILAFKNPNGRTNWAQLGKELGHSGKDLFRRHKVLSEPPALNGPFTKDEQDVIVKRFYERYQFDLRSSDPVRNGGRDLYDVMGSDSFHSTIWKEIGDELQRDYRTVESNAFQIWDEAGGYGSSSKDPWTDWEWDVLTEHLDTLPRGIRPQWMTLSKLLKRPNRWICSASRRRFSQWNSTADNLLLSTTESVLSQIKVSVSEKGDFEFHYPPSRDSSKYISNKSERIEKEKESASSSSGVAAESFKPPTKKPVPQQLLDIACLSLSALPKEIPAHEPPFETLDPALDSTALDMYQKSEKNLNQRVTNAFLNAGIVLASKVEPDYNLFPNTVRKLPQEPNPNETASQIDLVTQKDVECGVGGISVKRHLVMNRLFTLFSGNVIDWDLVTCTVNEKLGAMVFENREYNAKDVSGREVQNVDKKMEDLVFGKERIVRRWLFLKKEKIWNNTVY